MIKLSIWSSILIVLAIAQEEMNEEIIIPQDVPEDIIQSYDKYTVVHNDGVCMDGSPAVFYMHKGTTDDLIIYFYSGGFCIEDASEFKEFGQFSYIDNCDVRINTYYGSTKEYPDNFSSAQGLMGTSRYQNQHLLKATKVFLMYCDGTLWHKQMNKHVLKSILEQIGFNQKRVILAGSGVGAMYLLSQANSLKEVITADTHLLLDGIIYDIPVNSIMSKALDEVAGRLGLQNGNELFSLNMFKDLELPTFILHSQYDWWYLEVVHGFTCTKKRSLEGCTPKEIKQIEKLRKSQIQFLLELTKVKPSFGFWSIACVFNDMALWTETWQHQRFEIPPKSGFQLSSAFQSWLDQESVSHIHYDYEGWPYNEYCANINKSQPNPEMDNLREKYERDASRRKREGEDDL